MMVPIQVIRWYRMQCYDGTDSCATVVPIRRYCHLTDEQKQNNRIKSKDRCRIEHIFGFVEGAMNGSLVRSIGMVRAKAANALTNLVYNIFRYVQINIYQPQLITCKG